MYRSNRIGVYVTALLAAAGCGEGELSRQHDVAPSVSDTGSAPASTSAVPLAPPPSSSGNGGPTTAAPGAATSNSSASPAVPSDAPSSSSTGLTEANLAPTGSSSVPAPGTGSPPPADSEPEFTGSPTGPASTAPGPPPTGVTNGQAPEPVPLDCDAMMPASGAQQHSGNGTGGTGNLAWEIWSNTGQGELVTYDVPAFSGIWNEAGGYLGRLGYEWGGFGKTPVPYESLGTISARFVANKSGSGGDVYSYIGAYGWSTEPCVEWYVIEDSFRPMPVNPGTTTLQTDSLRLDDGEYFVYTRPTTGSGGTRCSGETEWIQYYSIRKTARRCGEISLTAHFDAWKELQMPLGKLLEAKILVEVGGGVGRVDFPVAEVRVD